MEFGNSCNYKPRYESLIIKCSRIYYIDWLFVCLLFALFSSNQEAVDIVSSFANTTSGAEEACKAIVEESVKRWNAEEEVVDGKAREKHYLNGKQSTRHKS